MSIRTSDGVLTPEVYAHLQRACLEMRHGRHASGCSATYVSWNEGYFRGAVEAAALIAGVSPDELLEWLQADPVLTFEGARLDGHGTLHLD